MAPKILFISHDASRTGAPILLLNLLRWIQHHTDIEFDILLLEGGALVKDFEKLAKVYYWQAPKKPIGLKRKILNRVKKHLQQRVKRNDAQLLSELQSNRYSILYANTIVSIQVIEELKMYIPDASVIIHTHEQNSLTQRYYDVMERLKTPKLTYIAVSDVTRKNLIDNHGVPKSKIEVVYEYIDASILKKYRHKNPIKTNHFIINGSGLVQIRKGYDIFILIAKRLRQKFPDAPFYFRWIGDIQKGLLPYIEIDIREANLEDVIEFTGVQVNPYPFFAEADAFLLTSREDPFPLTCLEHAFLGVPIVCFEKVTGIPEFLGDDAGIVVPYLDIEHVVDALFSLYTSQAQRTYYAKNAHQKAQNYDIHIQAPKILKIIYRNLGRQRD